MWPKFFLYPNGQQGVYWMRRYYAFENGRWLPGLSPAQMQQAAQSLQRLQARDPGGNITLR